LSCSEITRRAEVATPAMTAATAKKRFWRDVTLRVWGWECVSCGMDLSSPIVGAPGRVLSQEALLAELFEGAVDLLPGLGARPLVLELP
jgi:hypothetical protein